MMSLNSSLQTFMIRVRRLFSGLRYHPERHYMRGHGPNTPR